MFSGGRARFCPEEQYRAGAGSGESASPLHFHGWDLTRRPVCGNTVCNRMRLPGVVKEMGAAGTTFFICCFQKHRPGSARRVLPTRNVEGKMNALSQNAELSFLEEWVPERMDPGTVFMLENQSRMGVEGNPYVAVMSCPRCGTMGLIWLA